MEIPKLEKGEIYIARNKIDNKIYIGQVRSHRPSGAKRGTRERWYEHVRSAVKKEEKCVLLERAIREVGANNFSVDIITFCHLNEIDDLEKEYIKKYKSYEREFGYNMTFGGKAGFKEITSQMLSIKVKEQWKNPDFREKVSEGVKKASSERWKNPETREKMRKGISETIKRKNGSGDLPEYLYYYKNKGVLVGYRACINRFNKKRIFSSSKLSMKEKYTLGMEKIDEWKKELGLN